MTQPSPVADGTLDAGSTVTTVPLSVRRKVCYEFDTRATKADLALPYRVSINGAVQEAEGGPRALSASNRKINLLAEPGTKIALFLNSDVHPDFRRNPVYALQVGDNDVVVKITEQTGPRANVYAEVGRAAYRPPNRPGGPPIDFYTASLTGDIWLQISHKYTEVEADGFLPAETIPAVRQAVRAIYAGLSEPTVLVSIPASDSAPAHQLRVRFAQAENASANITSCSLLRDVLTRTHPCAFASLFSEACNVGVKDMLVTSCWRPMLGSIVHRAGLGIDVIHIANAAQQVHINRTGLTTAAQNANVSAAEKALYLEYIAAKQQTQSAAGNSVSGPNDHSTKIAKEDEAKNIWNEERKKNEPQLMNEFRARLEAHPAVKQIFDPWYMDMNTGDQHPHVANEQRNSNEKLHANHLHVTVKEPKIL